MGLVVRVLVRFDGESTRPEMRDWVQAQGAGITVGAAVQVDGLPCRIVGIQHQAVVVAPEPDLTKIIYAQLRAGQPYRLVGAATSDCAVEQFRQTLKGLQVRDLVVLPYTPGVTPRYSLAGYRLRMLKARLQQDGPHGH